MTKISYSLTYVVNYSVMMLGVALKKKENLCLTDSRNGTNRKSQCVLSSALAHTRRSVLQKGLPCLGAAEKNRGVLSTLRFTLLSVTR